MSNMEEGLRKKNEINKLIEKLSDCLQELNSRYQLQLQNLRQQKNVLENQLIQFFQSKMQPYLESENEKQLLSQPIQKNENEKLMDKFSPITNLPPIDFTGLNDIIKKETSLNPFGNFELKINNNEKKIEKPEFNINILDIIKKEKQNEQIREETVETFVSNTDYDDDDDSIFNESNQDTDYDSETINKNNDDKSKMKKKRKINEKKRTIKKKEYKQQNDGSYLCEYCSKKFDYWSDLTVHLRCHTGDRPFSCVECGKKFSRKGNLKTHELLHSGIRPFECEICNKTFVQLGHLQQHLRTHNKVKPFVCQYCSKGFARKDTLKTHLRIHTGEKPYKCKYCDHKFAKMYNFKTHMQEIHSHQLNKDKKYKNHYTNINDQMCKKIKNSKNSNSPIDVKNDKNIDHDPHIINPSFNVSPLPIKLNDIKSSVQK